MTVGGYKPLISRRLLICLAIVVMTFSFFTDRPITGLLILMAIVFLGATIMMSLSMGCGACWAGFWLSDDKLDCMGRSEYSRNIVNELQEAQDKINMDIEKERLKP